MPALYLGLSARKKAPTSGYLRQKRMLTNDWMLELRSDRSVGGVVPMLDIGTRAHEDQPDVVGGDWRIALYI